MLKAWLLTLSPIDLGVLALVMLIQLVASSLGMWAYSLVTLIGTVGHELAHFLVALVLGANPSFPNIIPERTKTGWRLGSVVFRAGFVRAVPIALAPLLLAPLGQWWASRFLHPASGLWYCAHEWMAGTLVMASLPSRQDWTVAAPFFLLAGSLWAGFEWITR